EWHPTKNGDLDPWMIAEKSNQRFWWKCTCGHEWRVSVNSRVTKKTGCPMCGREKQRISYHRNLVKRKESIIINKTSV
ncbi:MAG: zinc-ribbon domain-containing protein, partial [Lachnospiraceae bacterium]|nr:zinc-ribbon domain-containing protein [Lachnospiraceae bacterium]